MKTTVAGTQNISMAPFVIDEITLIGSRCGPFDRALHALQNDEVDVLPLIAARYPLHQAPAGLDHAAKPGVLKVLLDVGD